MRITKTCQFCDKKYQALVTPKRPASRSKYCSRNCANKAIGKRKTEAAKIKRICPICDTEFYTTIKDGGKKSCSSNCANKLRAIASRRRNNKITVHCAQCGADISEWPSRIDGRNHFCNYECANKYKSAHPCRPTTQFNFFPCANCGKIVKRFNSRLRPSGNYFCSRRCYMAYSGTNTSTSERAVEKWLADNHLPFQPQAQLERYTIDFLVKDVYIEVHGCYWHGCQEHCPGPYSERIQKRVNRDIRLTQYCKTHDLDLIVIWEHDVTKGDFSALLPLTIF